MYKNIVQNWHFVRQKYLIMKSILKERICLTGEATQGKTITSHDIANSAALISIRDFSA